MSISTTESVLQIRADVEAAYQAPDFTVGTAGERAIGSVHVPPRHNMEQDTNLWLAYTRHRNALAARGFRLTMPSFKEQSFEATIERMRRD